MSRPVIEMEDLDTLCKGYVVLGSRADHKQSEFMPKKLKTGGNEGFSQVSPPVDKCNCIYFALVLAGVGFLLPYNSFIIAVDYFQTRYPGTTIVFDMSLLYILVGSVAVLINNLLVEVLSVHTRIIFGYVVAFFTLMFVAICEIWAGWFGPDTSYNFNLAAVGVVALGCTVQQSSFYGYTSMLPSRYTQAVMAGESAAGFIVSLNRIITKLLLDDQRINTLTFFVLSMTMVGLCSILHHAVRRSNFVKFYMTLCREGCKVTLEPTEDVSLMEPVEAENVGRNQYGVLKLHHTPSAGDTPAASTASPGTSKYSGYSFANPVYEPGGAAPILPVTATTVGSANAASVAEDATGSGSAAGPTYKVEDVIVRVKSGSTRGTATCPTLRVRAFSGLKRGLEVRWSVARAIWPYMLSIALAYFVTLCLYPGIESEIISCKYGSWMAVILMAIFNASDLLGKVIASVPYEWSRVQLLVFAACRLPLVPLLLLCATPRGKPILGGEYNAMVLSMVIGLTNGIVGSIPMIQAPSRVPEERRELAGNIMTLSYNVGLTTGSLVAYLLDTTIGQAEVDGCTSTVPHYISTELLTTPTTAGNGTSALSNLTKIVATSLATIAASSTTALMPETTATHASSVPTTMSTTSTSTLIATAASVFNSSSAVFNSSQKLGV